jgi:hypothetical protein
MKDKSWNTLRDVKEAVVEEGVEKVVSFNGYCLVTDVAEYGLSDGNLRRTLLADRGKTSKPLENTEKVSHTEPQTNPPVSRQVPGKRGRGRPRKG